MTAAFRDPRLRLIQGLRLRGIMRMLRDEARASPWSTGGTLALIAAGAAISGRNLTRAASASGRHAFLVAASCVAGVLVLHLTRRDRSLLRRAGVLEPALYALEYGTLLLPFFILLAWPAARPLAALAALGGTMIVACLPASATPRWSRTGAIALSLPLPPRAFEWAGGLRRQWPFVLLAYVVALVGAILTPAAAWPLVGLVLLTLVGIDAYLVPQNEGWLLVHVFDCTPSQFLRRKLALGLSPYAMLAAAPLACFFASEPSSQRAAIAALGFTAGGAAVGGAVLAKYALYRPGMRSGGATVMVLIAGMVVSLAVAQPLAVVMAIVLWRRGARAVAPYLHERESD